MSGLDFDQESTDFPAGDGAMKMQQRGPKVAGWSEIDLEDAEPPHVDDVSFISVASREAIALARLGDERPAGCRPGLAVHSRTVAVAGPLSKCGGRSAPAGASPAKRGTLSGAFYRALFPYWPQREKPAGAGAPIGQAKICNRPLSSKGQCKK